MSSLFNEVSAEDESTGANNKSLDFNFWLTIYSTTSFVESFFTIFFDFGEYVLPILANNNFR